MIRLTKAFILPLFLALLLSACASTEIISEEHPADRLERVRSSLPHIDREFRAVWVATVANIDWPSEPGLPVHRQQSELIDILNRVRMLGLNAIILQIRPTADAFYQSDLEPWSYYLTGQNGVAPDPFYDPLAFATEEAHRRGLDLHVWLNPYRAGHPTAPDSKAMNHVANRFPDAVLAYGTQLWMDPGAPEIADHSLAVIMDVVERYDIDGVHMDDYFYPYTVRDEEGNTVAFPDSAAYAAYGESMDIGDWRRQNVDRFIERVYASIKERKPWVLFGLSPFGIWRPGHPEGVTGFDQYEGLYADARKWLRNGWVDYYTPQLYWPMDSQGQPYGPLLDWWVGRTSPIAISGLVMPFIGLIPVRTKPGRSKRSSIKSNGPVGRPVHPGMSCFPCRPCGRTTFISLIPCTWRPMLSRLCLRRPRGWAERPLQHPFSNRAAWPDERT